MSSPLVSIGCPVYNGEATLPRALKSILTQDFEDFELIVSDNASTDGTRAICEELARRDRRIRYVRNERNIGATPNHNRVFHLGRGKYFQWIAHDLEFFPRMLGRCVEFMQQAPPTVVIAYPLSEMVDPRGKPLSELQLSIASDDPRPHRRLYRVLSRIRFVSQLYGLSVSEALRQTRLFGSFPSSDFVVLAEMAMLGEIREIPEVLFRREMDPNRGTIAVRTNPKKWTSWLDPQAVKRRKPFSLSYQQRLALEYFRSAWRLPLTPADKLRCLLVGPATPYFRDFLRTTGPFRHKCRSLFKS